MPSSNPEDSYKKKNLEIGHDFEKVAALYFERLGFTVTAKNWRAGRKEIDLIITDDTTLVFVEVKSSRSTKFGHPAERVDKKKQANLIEAANQYLLSCPASGKDIRFDVVTFINGQLEHYPNAFEVIE